MLAFLNGNKLPLSADFLPICKGNANEDLNTLTTPQVRNYATGLNSVKNAPISTADWFTVIVSMQTTTTGVMIAIADTDPNRIFVRSFLGNWHGWGEIALKS